MYLQKDKLLVKPLQGEEEDHGGLILPATMKRLSYSAIVVQMSSENGWFDHVALGDEVFYDKYAGRDITPHGEKMEIIDQSDIAVIKKKLIHITTVEDAAVVDFKEMKELWNTTIDYKKATEESFVGKEDDWMKHDEAWHFPSEVAMEWWNKIKPCLLYTPYVIPANYLLVKAKAQHEDFDIGNGQKFALDTSFHKEKFAVTYGEVVATPKKYLYFGEELNDRDGDYSEATIMKLRKATLNFKNTSPVKIGDKIHFHYLSIEDAIVKGYVLPCDEDGYDLYLIRYDFCFCLERGEEIIFVNGYCGVEIQDVDTEKDGLYLTDDEKNLKTWGKGVLRYMAEPNEHYVHYPEVDERTCPAVVGDTILFKRTKRSKVANDLFVEKEALKEIFYIQRKDISFVVTDC